MRTFASILKQQREITTSVAFAGTSIKLSVKGVQFKADAVQQPPLSALLSQRQAGLTVIGYPKELAPPPRRVCKLRLPPTGTFGASASRLRALSELQPTVIGADRTLYVFPIHIVDIAAENRELEHWNARCFATRTQ